MDIKELKQYILENDCIKTILENLGCHHIQFHSNSSYYTCGNPDGDNKSAITVYENDYITTIDYTRNINEGNFSPDIFSLVKYFKQCNFFETIKIVCDWIGINYYHDFNEDIPESLKFTKMLQEMNDNNTDSEITCLKPISENILNYYGKYVNDIFYNDNIDYLTQDYFELGYDELTNRITIPIRDELGNLVGVKGRLLIKDVPNDMTKYLYIEPCAKSQVLFGLYQNFDYIKSVGKVFVGESEKFTMQTYSYGDYNSVSIGGKKISRTQIEHLTRLCVDIIFCFDKDVSYNEIQSISALFEDNIPLYYMYDKNNILNEKESPSDNPDKWAYLKKNNIYKIDR